jgi:hypothetical protein
VFIVVYLSAATESFATRETNPSMSATKNKLVVTVLSIIQFQHLYGVRFCLVFRKTISPTLCTARLRKRVKPIATSRAGVTNGVCLCCCHHVMQDARGLYWRSTAWRLAQPLRRQRRRRYLLRGQHRSQFQRHVNSTR